MGFIRLPSAQRQSGRWHHYGTSWDASAAVAEADDSTAHARRWRLLLLWCRKHVHFRQSHPSLSLSLSRCLLVQCLSVPSVRLSSCPSYPIWTTWQLPVSATYRFHCQLRGRAGISCDRLPSDRPQQSPLGLPSLQKQQNNWYRGRSWRCPISHTAYTCYDFFLTEVNWSGPGCPYYLRWPCSRDSAVKYKWTLYVCML